jgi:hypothetical protein
MTDEIMTLLEAVESLALVEVTAVSWTHVIRVHTHHVAVFTIAHLLPFFDTDLPDDFRAGDLRLWQDRRRLLESNIPIEGQILELHRTRTVGNLALVRLMPAEREAHGLWTIKTHAGDDEERMAWMEAVIEAEGRFPWRSRAAKTDTTSVHAQPFYHRAGRAASCGHL